MRYHKNFELKLYNSFRLQSIAAEIWFPESIGELSSILKTLRNEKFFVLSGGTNVLLKEEIQRVICLRDTVQPKIGISTNNVYATATVPTCKFVQAMNNNRFKGIEGLYGMPGLLGGAIMMNAGSGNYTISDYLKTVITMDLKGNTTKYYREDLGFRRRYCSLLYNDEIIIGASFEFEKGDINSEMIKKSIKHRLQMPKYPSAGGMFSNWHVLKPYKGKLIGLRVGDAEVSDNVNIIINKGNATFKDIVDLIKKIQLIIKDGLILEAKIIG